MKAVLLSGSPRREGNTVQILGKAAETLEEKGIEAEVISLAGKDVKGCTACYACKETGKCVFDDGINEIADKIKEADAFIVGSPVYYGTARGDLMNALQRIGMLSGANGRFLDGKIGGPVAVGRRGGLTSSLSEMLMFFFINGMTVPGSTYWNMVFGRTAGEALEDEEGMRTITNFANRVGDLILLQNK